MEIKDETIKLPDKAENTADSVKLEPLVKACFICMEEREECLTLCPHCQIIYYCGPVCAEIHRHENVCFPIIVRSKPELGRYMVAARDIKPLELLLWEQAAVVGPYSKNGSGCLQCLKKVDGSYLCSGCQFPMCNVECEKGLFHQAECQFFQDKDRSSNRRFSSSHNGSTASSSPLWITPLRMLLKKKNDQKMYNRINMLRDHTAPKECDNLSNAENLKQVSIQMLNVVMLLQDASLGIEEFSQQEIHRMIGILKTNGMKLEPHGNERGIAGVALYPIYCLFNHSCCSNTNYVKFPDYHLELRSQIPIQRGEEISTRYISATIGNMRRREDIRKFWFFDCKCKRCSDSTELGSYMSAVTCFACKRGFLLPISALEYKSDWQCDHCQNVVPYDLVNEVISTIESQVGVIETGDIDHLEEMLYHFSSLLHPNHYIIIDIMHNLVHLYAAKPNLSRPEKERKIQLCVTVLETLVKIDPGFTKWRGTLLQEMIHTVMMVSKEDYASKRITTREFHKRLSMCARKLEEAKKCLLEGFTSQKHQTKESRPRMD